MTTRNVDREQLGGIGFDIETPETQRLADALAALGREVGSIGLERIAPFRRSAGPQREVRAEGVPPLIYIEPEAAGDDSCWNVRVLCVRCASLDEAVVLLGDLLRDLGPAALGEVCPPMLVRLARGEQGGLLCFMGALGFGATVN